MLTNVTLAMEDAIRYVITLLEVIHVLVVMDIGCRMTIILVKVRKTLCSAYIQFKVCEVYELIKTPIL